MHIYRKSNNLCEKFKTAEQESERERKPLIFPPEADNKMIYDF